MLDRGAKIKMHFRWSCLQITALLYAVQQKWLSCPVHVAFLCDSGAGYKISWLNLLTYLLTYGVSHCPYRCENWTQRSNYSDLQMLFFRAGDPPAQRPEQTVSVAGDRTAAPRRNVRRERAHSSRTRRRRQRKLNGQLKHGGLNTLPFDARRIKDDRRTERWTTDGAHRRSTWRQFLRRRWLMMMLLLVMMMMMMMIVTIFCQSPAAYVQYFMSTIKSLIHNKP